MGNFIDFVARFLSKIADEGSYFSHLGTLPDVMPPSLHIILQPNNTAGVVLILNSDFDGVVKEHHPLDAAREEQYIGQDILFLTASYCA